MPPLKDLSNQKIGKLTVIRKAPSHGRNVYWLCKCDCGNEVAVRAYRLIKNTTTSCLKCFSGPNHHNWKSEKTDEERLIDRNFTEYINWRLAVYERDSYTCQCCKEIGKKLNAHHIENYSSNPDKRLVVENGITLCVKCHNSFHAEYGRRNNNKIQMDDFLRKKQ